MIRSVLFFSVLLAVCAQQPGAIRGVVLSTTGEPIRKADVSIRSGGSGEQSRGLATTTDGSGRFAFEGIPAAGYLVSVQRIGFVSQKGAMRKVQLGPGESLDVSLALAPQAVISGRVTDEDGDPVFGASVTLVEQTFLRGKATFVVRLTARTNDLGEYRMPGLKPGRYQLAVQAQRQMGPAPIQMPRQPGANLAVVPAFYPSPVELQAGQELRGIDVQVRRAPVVSVSGRLVDPEGNAVAGLDVTMTNGSNAAAEALAWHSALPNADGTFTVPSVPAGSYVLQASAVAKHATARTPIQVGSRDLNDVVLRLQPPASITGSIRADGSVNLGEARVTLDPVDGSGADMRTSNKPAADGRFQIVKVAPGRYQVMVFGAPEGWYLKSALWNGDDVSDKGLTVEGDATGLEVVLAKGAAQLEGSLVRADGSKAPSGAVVLAPEESRRANWSRFQLAVSDQTGAFTLRNVPPGNYVLLGFADGEDVQSIHNPEVLAQLASKGKSIKLDGNPQQSLEVKVIAE